ncbi:uncharacterized protein I303_108267 [Kwoniella dejecticola CBS 10117]|uniref:NADH:ubiquinone oxidoreductase intermediate-associated protein 30 domain-containing protein n=1 Tax=Kwoniella dejecticola CBS 10117 TaxID=1296121 RepID=A0A1A5ZXV7_9TREE|nr:uncharacterized protein I303_07406 [Kwoniella dejecticola CBS 10117]OBR82644.1 hypothetical protein I303_07406 [Kwoniella dejecticola CBS 10117]
MSLRSVLDPKTVKVSVSSTAPGSSKKHLLNPSASDEGIPWSSNIPSSLHLTFDTPVQASHFALTFQGGFVSTAVSVWVARSEDAEGGVGLGLMMGGKIYPEDRNKRQVFEIPFPPTGLSPTDEVPPSTSEPTITTEITAAEANSGAVKAHPDGQGIVKKHSHDELPYLTELKLEFEKSSDQYGRVTLYSIEVLKE